MKHASLLGRAVTINPDFAAAHAYDRLHPCERLRQSLGRNPERSLQTGLEIAERAVHLDDEEAQGHYVLALLSSINTSTTERLAEARRCLALAPNSSEGHLGIARILTYSGNAAAAIDMIDADMQLDPLYRDIALYFLAEARVSLGQFDEAVAALKTAARAQPQFRDVICSAGIVLRPPRRNRRKSGGLGGGDANCSEFLNRVAAAHPAV